MLITASANIGLFSVGLGTSVLAGRLLGPTGRGMLAAIQTWPTLLAVIAMVGLDRAVAYFLAQDPANGGRYLSTALLLASATSGTVLLIGLASMPFLVGVHGPTVVLEARRYLIIVPTLALTTIALESIRGMHRFVVWNALRLVQTLAWASVLLLAWHTKHSSPAPIVHDYLVAVVIVACLISWVAYQGLIPPRDPSRQAVRPLLRFGLPSAGSTLPQLLNLRLDQMLMTSFFPSRQLGLYVIAVAWGSTMTPALQAIAVVLLPSVAATAEAEQSALLGRSSRQSVLVAIATAAALCAITPMALTVVYGSAFRGAIPSALVLIAAGGSYGVAYVLEEGLRGIGDPNNALWAQGAGLTVTAISLAVLLPGFGILGASVSSLAGYSTVGFVHARRICRRTGLTMRALLVPNRTDASELISTTARILIGLRS